MMSKILVLGSGIGGSTAAHALAEMGHHVDVVECSDRFGGKVIDYCCKATDECSRCGVCVATTQLHETLRHPGVRVHVGASLEALSTGGQFSARIQQTNPVIDYGKCIGCDACVSACPKDCISRLARGELVQYRIDAGACLLRDGKSCQACADACPAGAITAEGETATLRLGADAVLVATGHRPYPAQAKVRLGYGRLAGVMTGVEAEEALRSRRTLGEGPESVAFVQCVGSRDPKEGHNYCSSVCCAYALRLARMLKHHSPASEVTIYYIDIQNFDKTFSLLRRELVASGIHFVRGVPFRIEQTSAGRLQAYIENPEGEQPATGGVVEHDRIVLSVGMEPAAETQTLVEKLGLLRNEFGFLATEPASARTNLPAVYACGTCREPQSIPDTMAAARAAAFEINRDLSAATGRKQAVRAKGGR
jgi:heterodisulfide reductase subunit A-like polyferredoxin